MHAYSKVTNYATMMKRDYGINIVATNNSYGGGGFSQAMLDAIEASRDQNILFIAAAGNSNADNDKLAQYPSGYEVDNVIAVAASTDSDKRAGFSSYGESTVDLAAPGAAIWSTVLDSTYASYSGTSMAAPHVAGVAALARDLDPDATYSQVREAILLGADPLDSLSGLVATGARLNALGALKRIGMHVISSSPGDGESLETKPNEVLVDISRVYDPQSVDASDLTINGVPADSFTLIDADSISFHFDSSPVEMEGPQVIEVTEGAIVGTDMTIGRSRSTFYYDESPTGIASVAPPQGEILTSPPVEILIEFDEPILNTSVGVGDLRLDVGRVRETRLVGGDTVAYVVSDLIKDGVVEYKLPRGVLVDLHGNPSPQLTGSFVINDPVIERVVSGDIPKTIIDGGTVISTLEIFEPLAIADLDVELDIQHTHGRDLNVILKSPDGTRVDLFTRVGSGGEGFSRTVLDDEAIVPIEEASAPFTGKFRPEEPLSQLDGLNAQGVWTLEVSDVSQQDVGTLNWWAISVEQDLLTPPRITSVDPLPLHGQPTWSSISELTVQFSEAMFAESVTEVGNWMLHEAGADKAFDSGDDVEFALSILPYDGRLTATLEIESGVLEPGSYRLRATSGGLADLRGNLLDGDGDGNGGDDMIYDFEVKQRVSSFPFIEDFEHGPNVAFADPWEIETTGTGRVEVTNVNESRGAYHLELSAGDSEGSGAVILHVDLLDGSEPTTGVTLDFWEKTAGPSGRVQVRSNPDTWWRTLVTLSHTEYTHYALDLDSEIERLGGVEHSDDFQIRFVVDATEKQSLFVDDIRLVELDLLGAEVVLHRPFSVFPADPPLNHIEVTFDEPIEADTFTAEDITVIGPLGQVVPMQERPLDTGDAMTFEMPFAQPQTAAGYYSFSLGPDVLDLAGNPMNQDGDTVSGELDRDRYEGNFTIALTDALTLPVFEEFEGGAGDVPTGWSFSAPDSEIRITESGGPHGGDQHLRFVNFTRPFLAEDSEAVFLLDLSSQASRQDLALDFRAKTAESSGSSSLSVDIKDSPHDSWRRVDYLRALDEDYGHYAFDLDEILLNEGITLDEDVFVRFHYSQNRPDMMIDNVRVSNEDVFGPHVVSVAGIQGAGGDVNGVTVAFNEPIDSGTLSLDEVTVTSPAADAIALGSTVDEGDGQTFRIEFQESQLLFGDYSIVISAAITDLAGNHLNQDQDSRNGDSYRGIFAANSRAIVPPFKQGFEVDGDLGGWEFTDTDGSIYVTDRDDPHSGSRHLKFDADGPGWRAADLLLDLSGQVGRTDLTIDYWAKELVASQLNNLFLGVSADRENWHGITVIDPTDMFGTSYAHFVYDLDQELLDAEIEMDQHVYLRFQHSGGADLHDVTLDDVRISNLDLSGPYVMSQTPTGSASAPVLGIELSFNEPIDPSSLTVDALGITGPTGNPIALSGDPVADAAGSSFAITFATEQHLPGIYQVMISDSVTDLAGNPLNQDRNAHNGDRYHGQFRIDPVSVSPPVEEGFEAGVIGGLTGWGFSSLNGRISITRDESPYNGDYHLMFDTQTFGEQRAILRLDLSEQQGREDLVLEFWQKALGGSSTGLAVRVSGDGVNWNRGVWAPARSVYERQAFDLDQMLKEKGIDLGESIYLAFQHNAYSVESALTLDSVRVSLEDARLSITSLEATSTGFLVQFDRPLDTEKLNLNPSENGPSDLEIRDGRGEVVPGSLVVGSTMDTVRFIKTGGPLTWATYSVTLRSGSQAFKDAEGNLLDGDNDGIAGGDYVQSFTVAQFPGNATTISVPDFVRGPGQPVNLPADIGTGIPLTISGGSNVRAISLRINYDPDRLTVTGAEVGPGMPDGATVNVNTTSPGETVVSFGSPTNLPEGAVEFVSLLGAVPATARSKSSQLLDLQSVVVTDNVGNTIPVVEDSGLHVVAYFGDVSGNGSINAADAVQVAEVASELVSGFGRFPLVDPTVIGDISGDGDVDATDASKVAQNAAQLPVAEIPPIPAASSPAVGNPVLARVFAKPATPVFGRQQADSSSLPARRTAADPLWPAVDYLITRLERSQGREIQRVRHANLEEAVDQLLSASVSDQESLVGPP